ncbi:MAG: CDP-alcohol phosphatidyltransferase family protein [Microbacteriaceae bacterium]|nr:CDP-alcohol phosphatidyltransferase family protein [Microbacteriaceae bacterium]
MGADGQAMTATSPWRHLPNIITVTRILFAPAVLVLVLADAGSGGAPRWWATGLFAVGMLTDGLDGALARSHGWVSDFGKLADPVADKALVACALVALAVVTGSGWMWAATVLILAREVAVTVFRMAVRHSRVLAAHWPGKVKTAWQGIGLTVVLAPLWRIWGEGAFVLDAVIVVGAVLLTWYSGVEVFRSGMRSPADSQKGTEGH